MDAPALTAWLASLDGDALAAVLERRADVVGRRPPATLGQLADRLDHPASVRAALHGLTAPCLQVLIALRALGERGTRDELVALLAGGPGPGHERAVDAVLAELRSTALVWPGPAGRLEVPAALGALVDRPLDAGPTAREVWEPQLVDSIRTALQALGGVPAGGRKADLLEALLARLADAELVRQAVARAPAAVAAELHRAAEGDEGADDDPNGWDPARWQQRHEAEQWAVAHGLLPGTRWGATGPMPAEVALALRGPGYRAPFTPDRPGAGTHPVGEEEVRSATAAAVSAFATSALAVLDRLARDPVPRLAAGGVGVRELGRLVKELSVEEPELRLVLELAAAGGLLEPTARALGVAEAYDHWRRTEPAAQVASLVSAWWTLPFVPSAATGADGKARPALGGRAPCEGCAAARVVLLEAAAALPPRQGADGRSLAAAARWTRPLVHVLPQDAGSPLATVHHEAELLGVLAAGALSPLGAGLLAGDLEAVHDRLRELLPAASDSAVFGSDLTAVVAGTPSARVTALLDACADRESSGGAVTWRFSPASVRRALDGGATAADLLAQLSAVATRDLPQPLAYLIGDVGRRHGRLRLLPAVSLVRSDDEALITEVAADRRLAKLGLRAVAPTVLSCAVPLEVALARLREVGYLPVAEPGDDPARPRLQRPPVPSPVQRPAPPRVPEAPHLTAPEPVDVHRLAGALLAGGPTAAPGPEAGPEFGLVAELSGGAPQLSAWEVEQLTEAIETAGRVRITYRSRSGAMTTRVVREPEYDGELLYGWCELRRDERVFALDGILSAELLD